MARAFKNHVSVKVKELVIVLVLVAVVVVLLQPRLSDTSKPIVHQTPEASIAPYPRAMVLERMQEEVEVSPEGDVKTTYVPVTQRVMVKDKQHEEDLMKAGFVREEPGSDTSQ